MSKVKSKPITSAKPAKPAKPAERPLSVGKTVEYLRLGRDMSQRDLAEAAGVDQSVISRLERGERAATLDTLCAISSGLGVPVVVLIGGSTKSYLDNIIDSWKVGGTRP